MGTSASKSDIMSAPPQEGLDPKLAALTDLAPAEDEEVPLNDSPVALENTPALGPGEQPPQVGQDPKLMECVNDGEDVHHEEAASLLPDHTANASTKAGDGTDFTSPHTMMHTNSVPDNAQQNNSEGGDTVVAPQLAQVVEFGVPNKDNHQPSNPPTKQEVNVNPILTSAESLAEWNRMHDASNNGSYGYDFFKNSEKGKQIAIAMSTKTAAAAAAAANNEAPPPIEDLIAASGARSAAKNAPNVLADPPAPASKLNSNFWLQEEEERFLLGIRLYGWGQWKRIQSIVQTRTNKQIKSHAQKRAKVNPEIKTKYSKVRPRKGRISSKVLADDVKAMTRAGGGLTAVSTALLNNDQAIPSLDQAWKDVYGTNTTFGPNSRVRRPRQRQAGPGEKVVEWKGKATTGRHEGVVVAQALLDYEAEKPTPDEIKAIQEEPTPKHQEGLFDDAAQQHNDQQLNGQFVPIANHPQYVQLLQQDFAAPLPHDSTPYTSTAVPLNEAAPQILPTSPFKDSDTNSLRPGMRVYSRDGSSSTWMLGTIYTAKVDSTKLTEPGVQHPVPLVYHVQYDNGKEDINVSEECIMTTQSYESAIYELEQYHALPSKITIVSTSHPQESGSPIYCQWMDMSVPEKHGQWLPGTVHSYEKGAATSNNDKYYYHILFDNEQEKKGVPEQYVLDRNEYHELIKLKPPASKSFEDICSVFKGGISSTNASRKRSANYEFEEGGQKKQMITHV